MLFVMTPDGFDLCYGDDRIVSIDKSASQAIKLLPNVTLMTYLGVSHCTLSVNAGVLNSNIINFIKA